MKFQANTRRRALEYEKALVSYWKENQTFEKSVNNRPAENAYVFYDGPPFITGVPHHGTLLSSIVKDAVPRYQTMKGKRVERVWGWDTHGLPAENFVEKKLGIQDRHEIGTRVSLEEYITTARESMTSNAALWEDTIDRVGRWVDFKGAYKTMDKDYMESVWWAFKQLYEKGKIYEGEKVLMYDTKWATPLSKAEVTMDAGAYVDVTDPSVYVKFKLKHNQSAKEVALTKDSKVLFVCYGNVTRSQISKALYNHFTGTENADSAGVGVAEVHPDAVTYGLFESVLSKEKEDPNYRGRARTALLESHDIDIVDSPRQQLTPEHLEQYDLVVNIAERRQTPEWFRGDNVIWWDIKDPHDRGEGMQFVYEARDELEARVKQLVDGEIVDDGIDATYLLAWTTTPWTLPGNTALAVNEDVIYQEVVVDGEHLVLAKDLVAHVLTDEKHQPLAYAVVKEIIGKDLVGLSYEPLFADRGENAHKVYAADYVTTESGTGIVHLAPAYGEEDFELAKQVGIPVAHVLDDYGVYIEGDWIGQEVWESNKQIAKELKERGVVWKIDYIRHEYPHNPRTGHRLMYRAHPSWFMDIDGQRTEMLEENAEINWFPEHLKNGRFKKTVETAPDWNLSRDRFWATAMPVWRGDRGGIKVVGSYAELKDLSGVELEDYHRPWVDDVTFDIDGEHFTRIDKVIDCWFESGSMPFAQFHYPFENKDKFDANFPGDFIVEYVGQVRAWFYYVHAVNVGLFGKKAYKNVITTGTVAGNDGRKMSKSVGNYTDPNELMDKFSADSLRFLLLSSPLLSGEDFSLQDKEVGDVARKLSMVWNMYDFFTMYADVDGWEFTEAMQDEQGLPSDPSAELKNPLDIWVVSRVHQLTAEIEENMDKYDLPSALKPILPFIDDASNWYVRRSRRRFWKSEDDADKDLAYRTLHYVLTRLSLVLAPFVPFLAEELYQKLVGGESVHLLDWPVAGNANELVLERMESLRDAVTLGLSSRAQVGIKIRQPLSNVTLYNPRPALLSQLESEQSKGAESFYTDILRDELNVKDVRATVKGSQEKQQNIEVELNTSITPELKREGLSREVVRFVQNARKDAGLNVDDRINLVLATTDPELQQALEEHDAVIREETLATSSEQTSGAYEVDVTVDGAPLHIVLNKV